MGSEMCIRDRYKQGKGVAQDFTAAREWYEKAAAQEHAGAQNSLGCMHQNGKGVAQDYTMARQWYEKAFAQQDGVNLRFNLAFLYLNGLGVNQSSSTAGVHIKKAATLNQKAFSRAMDYYETEADKGDANAQHLMGYMFHFGLGVTQNDVRARAWYNTAADQGNVYAQEALENMAVEAAANDPSQAPHGAAVITEVEELVEMGDDDVNGDDDDWLEGIASVTGGKVASRPTRKAKTKKAKKGGNKKKKK